MDPDPAGIPGSLTVPPPTGEFAAIARWTRAAPSAPGVLTGPGDDVAWIAPSGDGGHPLALSVDTVVQGVHFRLDWSSGEDVGWKAITAALSDLAAARARPRGALISLALPVVGLAPGGLGDRVMSGALAALEDAGCPLLGGDTVRTTGPVTVSVTVIGEATSAGPLLRSGALPGDLLQLSGPTGLAAWAVAWLAEGREPPRAAGRAHRRPRCRLDLVDALAPASAAIDISDGLLADAAWLAEASGVVLELDRDACLASRAAAAEPRGHSWVLSGGDDYEILATAAQPLRGFRVIGRVGSGPGALRWADGSPATSPGWDHGRTA